MTERRIKENMFPVLGGKQGILSERKRDQSKRREKNSRTGDSKILSVGWREPRGCRLVRGPNRRDGRASN